MLITSLRQTCRLCQKATAKTKSGVRKGLCAACYRREWARANPERNRAIASRSYYKHREARLAQSAEAYKKDRERRIEQQRIRDLLRIDEKRDYNRKYHKEHKDKLASYMRAWRLAKKYNISIADYERMEKKQKGVCAICKRPQMQRARNGKTPLHVDHNHKTGAVRGLLCKECNTAIGYLEKAAWIRSAQRYLERASHTR